MPTIELPPVETAFKVQNGTATYRCLPVSEDEAADAGCPGANARLIGRVYTAYGRLELVTGKLVRVPGWAARRGARGVFAEHGGERLPLAGWVAA